MDNKVYLNGEYMPLSAAKISVLDRGFLFADGVYEVIPVYNGRLFELPAHLQRLTASLRAIHLDFSYTTQQWLKILSPLFNHHSGRPDQSIYLQITRGSYPTRNHRVPSKITPTVFAMCTDIKSSANTTAGIKALTLEDSRWKMCHIKATSLLANVLLQQKAIEQDCTEAILHGQGQVTEGTASNLFAVIDGILTTPPKTTQILPGITRQVVLTLAKNNAIKCIEAIIPLSALQSASEIWMTSSLLGIRPVIELDDIKVGDGTVGVVWQKMNSLFQAYKKSA